MSLTVETELRHQNKALPTKDKQGCGMWRCAEEQRLGLWLRGILGENSQWGILQQREWNLGERELKSGSNSLGLAAPETGGASYRSEIQCGKHPCQIAQEGARNQRTVELEIARVRDVLTSS